MSHITKQIKQPCMSLLKRSLPLLASFVILFLLIRHVEGVFTGKDFKQLLFSASFPWLLVAFIFALLTYFLNSYRFAVVSKEVLRKKIVYRQSLRITWLGAFFSIVTPIAALGDLARAGLVRWLIKVPIGDSIQVVLFDRGFSIFALIFLMPIGFMLDCRQLFHERMFFYQFVGAVFLLLLIAIVSFIYPFISLPKNRLFRFFNTTLENFVRLMKRPKFLLQQIIIGVGNVLLCVGAFWALSGALHFSFNLLNLLLCVPFLLIVTNLPIFYSGFGGREAAFILLLSLLAPHARASLVLTTSLGYGFIIMLTALFGGIYLVGLRFRESRPVEESTEFVFESKNE